MGDQDNLDCWPSDDRTTSMRKKHNIVAFYHQILWASQLCEAQQNTLDRNNKTCKVVSFSSEPPTIYEYEPEYSKSKLGIFDYQILRRRFQQHQLHQKDEHRQFLSSKLEEKNLEIKKMGIDEQDDQEYKNHKLVKTRSISEFRPLRNTKYSNLGNVASIDNNTSTLPYSFSKSNAFDSIYVPLAQIDIFQTNGNVALSTHNKATRTPYIYHHANSSTSLPLDENDPPPTYIEYNVASNGINEKKYTQFIEKKVNSINSSTDDTEKGKGDGGKHNDEGPTSAANNLDGKGPAFFQRTLRKIKSSPKLIEIHRRSSSLRKKKSFSMTTSA